MASDVQSIVFDREKWNANEARKWMVKNRVGKPIKRVDKTPNKLRYRLKEVSLFKRFRTKVIPDRGISFILGFKE